MTRFRPCIDLHAGKVKQIVGGTLRDVEGIGRTNFESALPAAWYAERYREDGLRGGHVIMLGPGNEEQARAALAAYPSGLQVGGGIVPGRAAEWIEAGASHVIVTSVLFDESGGFRGEALAALEKEVGRERLVIDLSCRRDADGWYVATNRWQTRTRMRVDVETLDFLVDRCAEYLIHAADVEGLCGGIDEELVAMLGGWGRIPVTYAGGARGLEDLELVERLSGGRVDLTIGSALDIFGGTGVRYEECLAFNRERDEASGGDAGVNRAR